MKAFYLAPRGSRKEVAFLIENWHVLEEAARSAKVELGLLLVPSQKELCELARDAGVKAALDNGAFQILKVDFDKPLSMSELKVEKWMKKWSEALDCEWEWVALLDVPVHGRKFVSKEERLRRILITAELHRMAYKVGKEAIEAKRLRIVAQGYEPSEYELSALLNLQSVEEADEVLALGSVCVRKDSALTKLADGKARGTAEELKEVLDSRIVKEFFKGVHFFGLHGKFVRRLKEHPMFFSADSGAAGAVFNYEIRDVKRKLGIKTRSRLEDYLLAHAVQVLRSTGRKLDELKNLLSAP